MNIKIQKILRFIPLINFITVFLWLRTLYRCNATRTHVFKKIFVMFGIMVLAIIPEIIVDTCFEIDELSRVFDFFSFYVISFVMSFFAVKDQENIEKSKNVN